MAADAAVKSGWDRFRSSGGWVVLILTLIFGTATIDAVVAAVTDGPSLDIEGAVLILQVFLLTFPFAVGVLVFTALAAAEKLKSGIHLLWAGALCLVVGAALGTALGSAGNVNLDEAAVYVHGGGPSQLAESIWWFLTAYYQLYGWQYFVAAIVVGVFFGYWAAWLVKDKTTTT